MNDNPESSIYNDDDFQKTITFKRRRVDQPKSEQNTAVKTTCPLCDLNWTNTGSHRIVNLKCGHTFGSSCIKDYVKKEGMCPICSTSAKKTEIRSLWPVKIFKDNTGEINGLQNELDSTLLEVEEKKRQLEEAILEHKKARSELAQLTEYMKNKEIQEQHDHDKEHTNAININEKDIPIKGGKYKLLDNKKLSTKSDVSRVMAVHTEEEMVVMSMKQENSYGLYKCSLRDLSSSEYIGNHSGLVRDIKCSKYRHDNGSILLLSTGLDKKIHLTSASNNCVLQTYQLPSPGWSCEFDESNPNQFYCGLANNSIMLYDIRNTKESLKKIVNRNLTQTPIHSIISFQLNNIPTLLCSSLTQTYYYQSFQNDDYQCNIFNGGEKGYQPYAISMDTIDDKILMISNRGNGRSKHYIIQLNADGSWLKKWEYTSPIYQKKISRTDIYSGLTCFSEDNRRIQIRDEINSIEIPLLEQNQCVMDLKLTHDNLFCLTDNHFMIYKYG